MHVWAVANQKGGVGKTTTAVALGGLLAARGKRVLLVDIDPHGSMTAWFRYNVEQLPGSSFDLFAGGSVLDRASLRSLLLETGEAGLSLLPASPALATVERRIGSQDGAGLRLGRSLAQLWDDFDYAIIDTPPVLGALMINALASCERLLIPVQTEHLALQGLERMLRTLAMVSRSLGKAPPHLIIPTLFDRRTQASVSSLRTLRNTYAGQIWPSMIPVDTRLRDASRAGVPPSRLAPESRGVQAYASLHETRLAEGVSPLAGAQGALRESAP